MKNQPKDHHYVPKFYLKYFSIPETRNLKYPKIWCQNYGNGNSTFPTGIHKIAYEKHLYSLRTDSGMNVSLENEFAEIEGFMSKMWELLNSQLNDSNDLKAYKKGLSLFISIMLNRNPTQFKEWEHLHKEITNLFGSLFENTDIILYQEENKENHLGKKEFEEYKNLTKIDIKESFIKILKESSFEIATELIKKRWSILICKKPLLITSDNPVIILNDKNFGINRPNTKIIFPISPYLSFYLDDLTNEPEWQYYPITDEQAIGLNYLQSISDIKLLLSPRPIDLVHAEIKESILQKKHGA